MTPFCIPVDLRVLLAVKFAFVFKNPPKDCVWGPTVRNGRPVVAQRTQSSSWPATEKMHLFIHSTSRRAELASSEFESLQVNCLSRVGSWCMCGFWCKRCGYSDYDSKTASTVMLFFFFFYNLRWRFSFEALWLNAFYHLTLSSLLMAGLHPISSCCVCLALFWVQMLSV